MAHRTIRIDEDVYKRLSQFVEDTKLFSRASIGSAAVREWLDRHEKPYRALVKGEGK